MNPVALVTGGAVRVGRAIALGLAESGHDVVVHYRSSEEAAHDVVGRVETLGRIAFAVQADLSVEAEVTRLAQTVEDRFGRLDLLVNSASSYEAADLLSVTAADWDAVMAVNLRAPFLLVRELADLLRASRGTVVNIVDLSAFQAWTEYPHHSVSKAGLLHLTRIMARALAPHVRVNAVAPGNVLPPEDHGEEEIARSVERTPLGRIGQPDDVVGAVRYLAGADYVTGEVIVVDGGRRVAP